MCAFPWLTIMDEDSVDPFSSFTIQSKSLSHTDDSLALNSDHCESDSIFENQNFKCQKLKPRRKEKGTAIGTSR